MPTVTIPSSALQALATRLQAAADAAFSPLEGRVMARMTSRNGVLFALSQSAEEAVNSVVSELLSRHGLRAKYSESHLRGAIDSIVANRLREPDGPAAVGQLSGMLGEYNAYSTEWRVLLPLVGVVLRPGQEVGLGNITLRQSSVEMTGALLAEVSAIIDSTKDSDDGRAFHRRQMGAVLDQHFQKHAVAEFKVVAEPTRAMERGREEARRAIDMLRYAVPALYPPSSRVLVGLPGEVPSAVQSALALTETECTLDLKATGAFLPLELSPDRLAHMERIGVFSIGEILKKDSSAATDFETALLAAVHWFGAAQVQVEAESAFLNLVACVEVLLTPRDGNPIGTAIAEAVALLLASGVDERQRTKRRFKELYSRRSAVSHGGLTAVLGLEFRELQVLCGALLSHLIARRADFVSREVLLAHLEALKFGLPDSNAGA